MSRRYYRGRPPRYQRSRTLNYVPQPGQFCVGERVGNTEDPDLAPMDFLPLACFDTFQEALRAEDIPEHQGFTSRHGAPRKIACSDRSRLRQKLRDPRFKRGDGRPIFEIAGCDNLTRHPEGWRIPSSELGAALTQETLPWLFVGAATAALIFLSRN